MNIWSRLGISVALVAAFCGLALKTLQHQSFYAAHRWYVCGGLAALGVILVLAGNALNTARRRRFLELRSDTEENESGEETRDPGQPFFLANVAYWGLMLVAFGASTALIRPVPPKVEIVQAREPVTNAPVVTNVVTVATPEVPTNAPVIKLQGLVFREPNSSVLINGRTYFVGDTFEDAQVVEIHPTNAVFQWEGKRIVVDAPR